MIIDFHTHIFPDKIAPKAIPILAATSGISPSMDGTRSGLLASMDRCGIDASVILPVVTTPKQFDSILRFSASINEAEREAPVRRLVSFAGIHPDTENAGERLRQIAGMGFAGIKIHPNYQGVLFDDIRYKRLIDKASALGLCVLTHAGYDPYTPDEDYCTPDMILSVQREVRPPRLILAHFGCNGNWEASLEKLCGEDLYMDTSFAMTRMPQEAMVSLIRAHGADRILFGSDAPWTDQRESADCLIRCPGLTEEEKEKILWKNAARLLGFSIG